jgi:hypothetical protein
MALDDKQIQILTSWFIYIRGFYALFTLVSLAPLGDNVEENEWDDELFSCWMIVSSEVNWILHFAQVCDGRVLNIRSK